MTNTENKKKLLYIDMDGVLVDFKRMLSERNLKTEEEIDAYVDNTEGIFLGLHPMKGALDAFEFLSRHFETYILSTAPWKNTSAWSDKRRWVEKHLGDQADRKLIITHRKDLNKGDYLIDDRKAKGADRFEGEFIQFETDRFPDWESVLDYLCLKEGINK
jgi:5'(3')-deoxyribonucleotidase